MLEPKNQIMPSEVDVQEKSKNLPELTEKVFSNIIPVLCKKIKEYYSHLS